jgi:hypothetical protein
MTRAPLALVVVVLCSTAPACFSSQPLLGEPTYEVVCNKLGAVISLSVPGDAQDLVRAWVEVAPERGDPQWAVFLYPEEEDGTLVAQLGPVMPPWPVGDPCAGTWTLHVLDLGAEQVSVWP